MEPDITTVGVKPAEDEHVKGVSGASQNDETHATTDGDCRLIRGDIVYVSCA